MTILLEIAVVAAIVFGVVAYVLGQFEGMRPAPPESGAVGLPEGPVEAASIDRTRFGLTFRGYKMDEVDAVLDRLRDELARRDGEPVDVGENGEAAPAADDGETVESEPAVVPQHEPGDDEAPAGDPDGPWPS